MEELAKKIKKNYHNEQDEAMLKKAFDFAETAHKGQNRLSGEPFFTHPYEVANILSDLGLDVSTVIAGLLHDVIEDTDITTEKISEEFNPEIARLGGRRDKAESA